MNIIHFLIWLQENRWTYSKELSLFKKFTGEFPNYITATEDEIIKKFNDRH